MIFSVADALGVSSLRACASAALKDVAAYFTKEQGQVAVSKRTTETVPLFTIKPSPLRLTVIKKNLHAG